MSETVIYHQELAKALAGKLPGHDVFWEPQACPRDSVLGTLTAVCRDNPARRASMNFEVQRDYFGERSEIAEDIREFVDGFLTHCGPDLGLS